MILGIGMIGILFYLNKDSIMANYLIKAGNVEQKEFKKEIPFVSSDEFILIKVEIEGKQYNFILDTGALNVVSEELAKELDIETISKSNGISSTGKPNEIKLAKLPNVKIGGIDFNNTATAIIDFKKQFPCLKIDGLIGSNLMKLAVWEVNNENKKIIITNSIDKTNVKEYQKIINFTTNVQANPFFELNFGNQKIKTLMDFGHNTNINIQEKFLRNISRKNIEKEIKFRGNSSIGIFKDNIDTVSIVTHVKVKELSIENLKFENKIVSFTKGDSKIGTSFFKNYNYIIDWSSKKIYLKEVNNKENDKYISYGFGRIYENNRVIISEILQNSEADSKLKLGDQIIAYNGMDWSNLTQQQWCKILEELEWPNYLKLKIKRSNEIKEITVEKEDFLN